MKNLLRRAQKKLRYFFQSKAIVLCYHRIVDVTIDPWELTVSPENFEQQLRVLKNYQLCTGSQLIEHLQNRSLKNGMICITFDDGYRDNYRIARPLLQKYTSPSTFFIPIHYIGQEELFWWDELQAIILGKHDLPQKISILINGERLDFDLGVESKHSEEKGQKLTSWIWYDTPPTKRSALYIELWKRLRPLDLGSISVILSELRKWSLLNIIGGELELPMGIIELKDMIVNPLFEIGVHTVTHPALAFHNRQKQYEEIAGCKERLVELGNKITNTIAYPYGIYNDDSVEICKQVGLKGGFTTENKAVHTYDHPLKLGRIHVKNWNGTEFEKNLRYWIKGFRF